ncbi:MAG: GNAT family N-acetyltransferase [Candidatus Obscuribacterales bacterium]|nr:GNAT family N-acetyltransferase [Candidatus Obscuribacterales bacterium]
MRIVIESPTLKDIDELLKLYFMVYGQNYPIGFGNNAKDAAKAINSESCKWLIARDKGRGGMIVGSMVYELDLADKVAKGLALVVHPDYRKVGIASRLCAWGDNLIKKGGPCNSVYTTTRTQSIGPQLIFLKEKYLPLGIFPNAHRIKRHETTTLFAKFQEGVLERRVQTEKIPLRLVPLYQVVKNIYPEFEIPKAESLSDRSIKRGSPWDTTYEAIYAPNYVLRRFQAQITDADAQFYPFHLPNLLIVDESGKVEIFAYYNQLDGYCTIISCSQPMYAMHETFPSLLDKLRSLGITYVEVLIRADRFESLEVLLRAQFLPSALYPAMREKNGKTYDYVIMTRTSEPLDFVGMQVDKAFKPYVDQYVFLWKQMHLESLEVFNDYK